MSNKGSSNIFCKIWAAILFLRTHAKLLYFEVVYIPTNIKHIPIHFAHTEMCYSFELQN